ncbi:hypothetical protein AB4403_17655 [Vibrio breoganii]
MTQLNKKYVVYTVVTDGYDNVNPIKNPNKEVDYVLVSNEPIPDVEGWTTVIKNSRLKNTIFNRNFKINPDVLFPHYEQSIYIDGNIEIVGDIEEFILSIPPDTKMALFDHPLHKTAKQEFEAIVKMGYANYNSAFEQYKDYETFYTVQDRFFECNIIYRKHNDPSVILAMRTWWSEFLSGIKRDQLSMHYSCSQYINIHALGKHDARFNHRYFRYHKHKKRFNRSLSLKHRLVNKVFRLVRNFNE